jgi:hypothetical protein
LGSHKVILNDRVGRAGKWVFEMQVIKSLIRSSQNASA